MIYVTIDTNIYLDILLDPNEYDYNLKEKNYRDLIKKKKADKRDNEEELYRYRENKLPLSLIPLKILCDNNVIKLIITEVTKLELEKHNSRCIEEINKGYGQLDKSISSEKMWNNISYIKDELKCVLEQNKKMNIENWNCGYKELSKFLQGENNIKLNLNADVICNLYRKNIAGLLGNNEKEVENATKNNDYLFVNIVQEYLKKNKKADDNVFLVTKDIKDFRGVRLSDEDGRDYYDLKDNFKDSSVDIKVLADIKSLYKWVNVEVELRKFINSKTAEVFQKREKNEEYSEEGLSNDYVCWYDENIRVDILNEFDRKNKSLKEANIIRNEVLENIKTILKDCRKLSSWTDRSEIKLYSWLDMNYEGELEILSLSELLTIRDNLSEYKRIHLIEI